MPREEGIVIEVSPEGALVRVKKPDACHGCPSDKLCHMGGTGEREVFARNPVHAAKGERVEVEVRDRLLLKASFIVYLFPVIGLLAGGLIGKWVVGRFGLQISQDTGAVIGGITCLLMVFFLIKLRSRARSSMELYRPIIVKIKPGEGS